MLSSQKLRAFLLLALAVLACILLLTTAAQASWLGPIRFHGSPGRRASPFLDRNPSLCDVFPCMRM